jgi:hypothetical protein
MADDLWLPAQVTIERVSLGGPFSRGATQIAPARVPLLNAAAATVSVARAFVSPLVEERTGQATRAGALATAVASPTLDAAAASMIEISGTVPARPGIYVAQLEATGDAGQTASAPVRVTVAASAAWGIGCMLLGLILLGVLKLLSGEGDVQDKARETQRARAEIHAWWRREPPPLSRAEAVAEIDRELDDASRTLAQPHPFSVDDHRIADASAALTSAREAAAKLRDALAKDPPGTAEVADLAQDWAALQERLHSLAAADTADAGPTGLAAHTAALLRRARLQLLGLPLQWVAADLGPQIERVRLAQAAGETDRARAMALATRAWLRRAADDLERRLTLTMGLNQVDDSMIVSVAWVRRLAAGDELPQAQRAALLDRLDAADAALAAGVTLADLATAARAISETETQATRDRADALVTRVQQAATAAADELSVAPMEDAMSELGAIAHPTVTQRAAALTRMLEIWRARLVAVNDAETRAGMTKAIDAAEAAAAHQDLAAAMREVHGLQHDWQAYLPRHIAAAGAAAVASVCRDWRDRNLALLIETENAVKLQSGRPEIVDWERRLDHARRGLTAVLPEAAASGDACLGAVKDSGGEVIAVSQAVFTRALADVPIPLQARLDAAQSSGLDAAIALAQQLMTAPRDLKLAPVTAEADRVAGQPLVFALGDLDPNWGSSVRVMLDWGDGTTPDLTDAEKLRQGERLEHSYADVGTVHPTVVAADNFVPAPAAGGLRADGPELGRSDTEVFIQRSPASTAERLADIFLTAQFGLALLIAAVVYFWRYHAGPRVFGTSGFHYVEAFSLGFAAYAAVADLPKLLAELPFK